MFFFTAFMHFTFIVIDDYRITGIFCGCLIFAVFCGSIEIAEIKNRKIFQSRYNDEIVSEVIVQQRIFRCLSGIVVELHV